MAVDEALLRGATERRMPLLRVYMWTRPAVSFGYFQKFPVDIAAKYEIVRRPTGGGMVYHGKDTTYTVVVPRGHSLYEMSAASAYCALHRAIVVACEQLTDKRSGGNPTLRMSLPTSPHGQYECFQNPVHGDVVADGRKLAGGAQRRTKQGMLHQGSIAEEITANRLQAGFYITFQADFQTYALTKAENTIVEELFREKYTTDAWNRKIQR